MDKKVYLVTGGSSGIGLEVVSRLAENGITVVSFSRSKEKISRALSEKPHLSGKVEFVVGDISNSGDLNKLSSLIEKKYGVLDGLVNNGAILSKGSLETTSPDIWNKTLDVNLTGPYLTTKTLLPLLKKSGSASVINISSVAGLKPGSSLAYSVSKAGLDMFTRFLAGDLGPYNIRVNSINPGLVKTNIHLDNKIVETSDAYSAMLEKAEKRYPLGKIGHPGDIAEMVLFLLSDKSKWVTGSIITVDGGVMVENDLIPPKK